MQSERERNTNLQKKNGLPKVEEKAEKEEREVEELKKRVAILEDTINKKEMESNAVAGILKEELKHCESKIKQLTGVSSGSSWEWLAVAVDVAGVVE